MTIFLLGEGDCFPNPEKTQTTPQHPLPVYSITPAVVLCVALPSIILADICCRFDPW